MHQHVHTYLYIHTLCIQYIHHLNRLCAVIKIGFDVIRDVIIRPENEIKIKEITKKL
jgi:hypothetical protein